MSKPTLVAEVVFLSPDEGGRQAPPIFVAPVLYRSHLVVQDRSVRHARMRDDMVDEDYWGVSFASGPAQFGFGERVRCVLSLDYFPKVDYAPLVAGASFTVREGARIVAHGIVLERRDAA
jgi:hypothetical protein